MRAGILMLLVLSAPLLWIAWREGHGARVLARGGRMEALEGESRPRNVVIEFPDMETALRCYRSETYGAAKRHREGAGDAQIMILEGVE